MLTSNTKESNTWHQGAATVARDHKGPKHVVVCINQSLLSFHFVVFEYKCCPLRIYISSYNMPRLLGPIIY